MKALSALLFLLCVSLTAQELIVRVVKADGEVQIRREEDRKWSKLKKNTPIQDNDVIQTSFKSACEIRAGAENILFMGSNSRMLVNISEKSDGTAEVAVTVFSGSVYSKIISRLKYLIYSSTAMARADKAVFNCTVDEAGGMAGFHVFSGNITVTNISIQGEQTVKPGDMTTVPPDAPPSQPSRINARQMSVLTRFYGSDFINQEIEASGIEIVSSPSVTTKTESSPSAEQKKESRTESTAGGGGKKNLRLFDEDALIRRLDQYEAEHEWMVTRPVKAEPLSLFKYRASIVFAPVLFRERLYNDIFLRPGFFTENFSAVLNLAAVSDSSGKLGMNVEGIRGVLDKVYSLDYRYRKYSVHAGEINGYTVGFGSLVKNYSNRVNSDNLRNTGLFLRSEFYGGGRVEAFTSSLADFHLSGINAFLDDTAMYAGVALVHESGQKMNLNGGDLGYRAGAKGALPDSVVRTRPVSLLFLEFDGAVYLINDRPFKGAMYASAFGVFYNDGIHFHDKKGTNFPGDGWSVTFPGLQATLGKYLFSIELFLGSDRAVRHLFNPFYEDNLFLLERNTSTTPERVDSTETLQSKTISNPIHTGIGLSFKAEPLKFLVFSVEFEKTLVYFEKDSLDWTESSTGARSGMLDIRATAGKGLYRRLPWAEAYFSNYLCGYFSHGAFSPFTPNTFTEMGGRVHFLARNDLECFVGVERYFYDRNGDWRASPSTEGVVRITTGAAMGF